MTSDETVPDFAGIYGSNGGEATMSPRMAAYLWTTSRTLSDTFRRTTNRALLLDLLPPIVARTVNEVWLDRFVDCFDTIGQRLGRGEFELHEAAASTGEEMALHIVIDHAEGSLVDGEFEIHEWIALLPRHGGRDPDFDRMRTVLFLDEDVLLLFDPSLDGVEDAESELNRLGRLVNLHPRDWFKPFESK